ncbi:hypothetical protein ACFYST_28395 [Kitasatospora sp. NPDC004614]|uniref:hypothetical protein n=1 Tax=unclassified Kitasatospora TaxID=2633591 RepID=UPI0036AADDC5
MNPLLWESGGVVAERIVSTALRVPAALARFGRRCEIRQFDTDATVEDVRVIICMGAVRLALDSSAATDSDDAARIPAADIARSVSTRPAHEFLTALPRHLPPRDRQSADRLIALIDSTSGPAAIRWERLSVLVRDFTATYDQTHRP